MDAGGQTLERAREAFARREWVDALNLFMAAQDEGPLGADDWFQLGDSAWWLGKVDDALAAYEKSYDLFLAEGRLVEAVNSAMGIAYNHSLRGNEAQASGWAGRGMRLMADLPPGPMQGMVVHMEVEGALAAGQYDVAIERARQIREFGRQYNDELLLAIAATGEGRALVKAGQVAKGMALLDEAMLAALSDRLEPSWAGNIYCHLMLACYELADIRRAAEWTEATARWCQSMPGAGPFMGICRVHRAQVLQVKGRWQQAEQEVLRCCDELAGFHVSVVAEAHYQLGEIRRQRGDLEGAEQAFRIANEMGRDLQPGLSLLRLAQGRVSAALDGIRTALQAEANDRLLRAKFCAAMVEIAIAAGELEEARRAADEIAATSAEYGSSGLQASAFQARGAVMLASGDPLAAIHCLRDAFNCWQALDAAYEAARSRLLLADAYEAAGDSDSAALHREAGEAALARLRAAAPQSADADHDAPHSRPYGLTEREFEVLCLVARGLSNTQIADTLVLSVRTVERHLSTVYGKLGLEGRNARAAAIALCVQESLVPA